MKILFALNHPAHYHLFKHTCAKLREYGHDTVFVIKSKDILAQLLQCENEPYHVLTHKRIGHNKATVIVKGAVDIIVQGCELFRFCCYYKPDLMVGTDYSITHVGKILRIAAIVFNEDDYAINKFFCNLAYPLATAIISPNICNPGRYFHKKIGYEGYQKLAYLHPARFKPEIDIASKYVDINKKIFLIRLVRLAAGHDIERNHSGIETALLQKICSTLAPAGQVFITSESSIPDSLRQYSLSIDPKDIHHLLAFADIFIADSQSMIVEAAMLGTPCIRFNSFVGQISVLQELEDKYGLAIGIHVSRPEQLIQQIEDMLGTENLRDLYRLRRRQMLAEKIDLTAFMVWLLHHYPQSLLEIKNNPKI